MECPSSGLGEMTSALQLRLFIASNFILTSIRIIISKIS
jgi:hypothetical protein